MARWCRQWKLLPQQLILVGTICLTPATLWGQILGMLATLDEQACQLRLWLWWSSMMPTHCGVLTRSNTFLPYQIEWMLRFRYRGWLFCKRLEPMPNVTELERVRSICAGAHQQCRQKDKQAQITEPPRIKIGMVFVQNRVVIELPQSAAFERQARGVTWNHEVDRTAIQMTMTMTLREVHPTTVNGLASRAWVKGHDTTKKRLPKLLGLALLTEVCTCTLLMTLCSYFKHKNTEEWVKHKLLLSLNSKSLESSDSVQQNEGSAGAKKTARKKVWQAP